jgi:hypothetical protein
LAPSLDGGFGSDLIQYHFGAVGEGGNARQ